MDPRKYDLSRLTDADGEAFASGDFSKLSPKAFDDIDAQIKDHTPMTAGEMGMAAVHGTGKALDYLGGSIGRPALAAAISLMKGKQLTTPQEYSDALNPTTSKRFPDSDEIMKRAGVPEGAHLSDVLTSSYAPKGQGEHWYTPEKGGMLDPSIRGTGGTVLDAATDPLTYLSLGISRGGVSAANVAEKSLAKTAAQAAERQALPVSERTAQLALPGAAEASVPAIAGMTQRLPGQVKDAAVAVAQGPSRLLSTAAQKLYEAGLAPLVQRGKQYGKENIGETLYKNGVWGTPAGAEERLSGAISRTGDARDNLLSLADRNGAQVSREAMFKPTLERVTQMVNEGLMTRDEARKVVDGLMETFYSVKGSPNTTLATKWKTSVRDGLPGNYWNEFAQGKPGAASKLQGQLGSDMKTAIENESQRTLGANGGPQVKNLNSEMGDLLTVGSTAKRQAAKPSHFSMLPDKLQTMAMMGMGYANPNHAAGGLEGYALMKALEGMNTPGFKSTVGYWTRKAAENPALGTLADVATRRNAVDYSNPWSLSAPEQKGGLK